jgi:hypothetical protein
MAQRTYNEDQSKQKRTGADKDWFDGATHVWQARIKQADDGEDTDICAEAKRLWEEAGMSKYWPPPVNKFTKKRAQRPINMAAEIIAITRLIETAQERSDVDGDTPYMELYDGTTWRLTNGERDEVGLITSARLGALMTNAGRPADGELLDPACTCCGHGYDTARHMMLECAAMNKPRCSMGTELKWILEGEQQLEYKRMNKQDKYMTLLGKQMENEMTMEQQISLDSAIKTMLKEMDALRANLYELQPLTGRTYNRPPEHAVQMLQQCQQMEDERIQYLGEKQMDGIDDGDSDTDPPDKENQADATEDDHPSTYEEKEDHAHS